jgi:Domain of unknown function (DUF1844)
VRGNQSVADESPSAEDLLASLTVEQLLVSAASTLASLAYAKLEAKDLPEARRAIDALASLVPHVEGDLGRELQKAVTELQVAFATRSL